MRLFNNILLLSMQIRFYLLALSIGFLVLNPVSADARWGATELRQQLYPSLAWVSRFSGSADIIASGSIEKAIDHCDQIVGVGRYCVVQIGNDAQLRPFLLSRSRTMLVGTDNMSPIRSRSGRATITIDEGVSNVVLENLSLKGHNAGRRDVYGILLYGESIRSILIKNNRIHNFRSQSNAHAIAVYGTGASSRKGISNVVIEGNDIRNMQTGSSESIAVNGNVRRWAINLNYLKDINNIGIDAIGGEGTSPTRIVNGKIMPGSQDVARTGWITNNSVVNMSTKSNPAYGNKHSWAAAIYVDGGRNILIEGNTVTNAPWAFEVGAENCVYTQNVTMRFNSSTASRFGDLLLGGYSADGYRAKGANIICDPEHADDIEEGHGYVRFLTIEGNEFNSVNTREVPVTIQHRTTGAYVLQANVDPENETGRGNARGDENAIRVRR